MLEFEYAWMFLVTLGLIAAVGVPVYIYFRQRSKRGAFKQYYANTARLTMTTQYKTMYRKYVRRILMVGSFLLVPLLSAFALSGKPVWVETVEPMKYNRDIVLCLDVSGSMIEVDEELIEKFRIMTKEFSGERIGLTVWNSNANQVFPLTDDYLYMEDQFESLLIGLRNMKNGVYSPDGYDVTSYTISGNGGSLIGDGLTACVQSFDALNKDEKRARSIILATDNLVAGEPLLTLPESIDIAMKYDITVYGITPMVVSDPFGEYTDNMIEYARQELKKETERTGGSYYELTNPGLVAGIVEDIQAQEAAAILSKPIVTKEDETDWFIIIIGIGYLVGLFLMRGTRL